MSNTVKYILTFIGGIFTGIILTFVLAFMFSNSNTPSKDVVLFEQPTQEIKAEKFEVMQVLPDGSALATIEGFKYDNYGTIVMFLNNGNGFFDDQIIEIPKGKCVKQIGTYQYMTRMEMQKTVPVVDFFDK